MKQFKKQQEQSMPLNQTSIEEKPHSHKEKEIGSELEQQALNIEQWLDSNARLLLETLREEARCLEQMK